MACAGSVGVEEEGWLVVWWGETCEGGAFLDPWCGSGIVCISWIKEKDKG